MKRRLPYFAVAPADHSDDVDATTASNAVVPVLSDTETASGIVFLSRRKSPQLVLCHGEEQT